MVVGLQLLRFRFPDFQIFRSLDFQILRLPDFQIFIFPYCFGLQISECGCGYQDPGSTQSRRSQQSNIYKIASDLMSFHDKS